MKPWFRQDLRFCLQTLDSTLDAAECSCWEKSASTSGHRRDLRWQGMKETKSPTNPWPFQEPKLEVPTLWWSYMVQQLHFRILKFPSRPGISRCPRTVSASSRGANATEGVVADGARSHGVLLHAVEHVPEGDSSGTLNDQCSYWKRQ